MGSQVTAGTPRQQPNYSTNVVGGGQKIQKNFAFPSNGANSVTDSTPATGQGAVLRNISSAVPHAPLQNRTLPPPPGVPATDFLPGRRPRRSLSDNRQNRHRYTAVFSIFPIGLAAMRLPRCPLLNRKVNPSVAQSAKRMSPDEPEQQYETKTDERSNGQFRCQPIRYRQRRFGSSNLWKFSQWSGGAYPGRKVYYWI